MMISMNEMGSTLRHKTSQSGMLISIDWVSANRFFSLLQQSEELVSFSEEGIPYIEEHIIVGTTLRNPQEQFEAFVTFQDEIRDPEWFFGKRYNDYVLLLRRNLNLPLPNFSLYSYDKNRTYLEHRMREELQLLSSSDFNLPRFLGVAGKNAFIEENLAVGLPMLTVISLDSKSTIFSETYIPGAFRLLDANQFLYHKPSTLSVMSAHSPEQYSELTQFLSFDAKRDKILVFQEYLADLSTNTSIETGKFVAIEIR